jgi:hypothetical protein
MRLFDIRHLSRDATTTWAAKAFAMSLTAACPRSLKTFVEKPSAGEPSNLAIVRGLEKPNQGLPSFGEF